MAKTDTLIFCFDGTANESKDAADFAEDSSISNVLKLHAIFGGSCAQSQNTWQQTADNNRQCSLYYSGVGTYGGWVRRTVNQALAPKCLDVSRILNAAFKDLEKKYQEHQASKEDGDTLRIFIFGFSRGAAIARIFAAQLGDSNRRQDGYWATIARIFKIKSTTTARKPGLHWAIIAWIYSAISQISAKIAPSSPAKSTTSEHEVDFLGVFDTVAAMGANDLSVKTRPASDVVLENGTMGATVKRAVHLVSLDEERLAFQPTLFNHDPERILEVWFPGVHSDVGGGFWFDGLSDITLQFMLDQVRQRFPTTKIADPSSTEAEKRIDYKILNTSNENTKRPEITRDDLAIYPISYGKLHPKIRPQKLAQTTLHHRLLRVNENDEESTDKVPLLHYSVKDRFGKAPDYRPTALRNKRYRLVNEHGQPEETVRSGIADLRE